MPSKAGRPFKCLRRTSRPHTSQSLLAGKRMSKSVPDQYRCGHVPLRGMLSNVIENYIHRLMHGNVLRRTNCILRIKHITRACNIPGAKEMSLVIGPNIANVEQFGTGWSSAGQNASRMAERSVRSSTTSSTSCQPYWKPPASRHHCCSTGRHKSR
jgi:hypothetical protein